jgi:uncharacterized protein YjbI with pentapeptide repeats
MSVRVSYKKQFVLGIILLIIFLAFIEILANIWWYDISTCSFEKSKIFESLDEKTKRQLCIENHDMQYHPGTGVVAWTPSTNGISFDISKTHSWFLTPTLNSTNNSNQIYINRDGFRGPEITKQKPPNTYRIFVVGGSTTFGSGIRDNETAPYFLQKMFDENKTNFKVQVINAGIGSAFSQDETEMVKQRLISYKPDLILVYDGYNDFLSEINLNPNKGISNATLWKERWVQICDLGKKDGFDTIITLQPILGTGKKAMSYQEFTTYIQSSDVEQPLLKLYPQYAQQLDELSKHCTKTADLRDIFDNTAEPIFFDTGHVGPKGNEIVAENWFKLIKLPSTLNGTELPNASEFDNSTVKKVSYMNQISDTVNSFFQNVYQYSYGLASSYKTPRVFLQLTTYYSNQISNPSNFLSLSHSEHKTESFRGINLEDTNLQDEDFSDMDFSNAIFVRANLSNINFYNANLTGANLQRAHFNNVKFEKADLRGADFRLTNANVTDIIDSNLQFTNLSNFNFSNVDISHKNFTGTILSLAHFDHTKMNGTIFRNATLSSVDLRGIDIKNKDLTGVDFHFSEDPDGDLSNTILTKANLFYTYLAQVNLHNADLHEANLTRSNLSGADLSGANLSDADLEGAILVGANLTGTNLDQANLRYANLTNTNLQNTELDCYNNIICH